MPQLSLSFDTSFIYFDEVAHLSLRRWQNSILFIFWLFFQPGTPQVRLSWTTMPSSKDLIDRSLHLSRHRHDRSVQRRKMAAARWTPPYEISTAAAQDRHWCHARLPPPPDDETSSRTSWAPCEIPFYDWRTWLWWHSWGRYFPY